jgi:hypothetical protein
LIARYWKDLSLAIKNPAYVCFIWFGMTAGVSLLATPIRFTAPTITRPVAMDIGRVVFAALNKAELVALVILLDLFQSRIVEAGTPAISGIQVSANIGTRQNFA